MKITLLLRVPFLDKIPNLKTLIVDFAKKVLTLLSSQLLTRIIRFLI